MDKPCFERFILSCVQNATWYKRESPMFFHLAWRSIWRHKRRTVITITSIAFGLILAVFVISLIDGVYYQMTNDAVRMQAGHITLEHPEYRHAPATDLWIENITKIRAKFHHIPEIENTKPLIIGQGVAKSSHGAIGVAIMGIEAATERISSPLAQKIISGHYLEDKDQRQIIIGRNLADQLKLKIGHQ